MHVVICGGGVIGAACAYELSRRAARVTLVERWRVGGSASGKSGGFLARDWCDGTPVAPLAQRSFDLHAAWADQLGNPYGYRTVDTFSAAMSRRPQQATPHQAGTAEAAPQRASTTASGRSCSATTATRPT